MGALKEWDGMECPQFIEFCFLFWFFLLKSKVGSEKDALPLPNGSQESWLSCLILIGLLGSPRELPRSPTLLSSLEAPLGSSQGLPISPIKFMSLVRAQVCAELELNTKLNQVWLVSLKDGIDLPQYPCSSRSRLYSNSSFSSS